MSSVQFNQNFFDVNEPHLKDLLTLFKKQSDLDLNCHHLGTIQNFDPATQTVQVTINYKQTYWTYGENSNNYTPVNQDYPIIADCPLIILGSGDTRITFPIKQGDQCILLFNDRDIDNWFLGSTSSPNATPRLHSFSDAIALIGPNNKNTVIQDYDPIRAIITNGTTKNGINPQTNKLTLTNGTSLNTLLQNLCTQLENLTTQITNLTVSGGTIGAGISGTPLNSASFITIGNNITSIANNISQLIE
jgi:hypothetical protein